MHWAGVFYSDQNQMTQNHKTKLRLEGTSGVIPPQVQDFPFAFVDVHSMSNLDLISTPGCTACDQPPLEFLAEPNSPSGFQPTSLSIYPVCILSICLWWTWTNSLARGGQTAQTALPHPQTLWGTQCGSPYTYQCWCPKIMLPFLKKMVSRRILSIALMGIVVRLIPVSSNQFWPVLTGCNSTKLAKTSSNQFWLVLNSSDWFQPIQTGTKWFQVAQNWFEPIIINQNQFEQVGTGGNCPELIVTTLNWFKLVRTGENELELLGDGLNLSEPVSTCRNWSEPVVTQKWFEPFWAGRNLSEPVWTIGDVSLGLHGKSSTTLELSLLSHKMAKNWMCRKLQTFPQPPGRSLHPGAEAHWHQRALLTLLLIYGEVKCFCFQTPHLKHFLRAKNV